MCEHVGLGLIHQDGELRQFGPELVGNATPLRLGRLGIVLRERRCDEGGDDAPATAASVG
jgi:hypothetical protein